MTKHSQSAKDLETIDSIDKLSNYFQACGIIQSLSPLKKSCSNVNYFEGELADNTGKSGYLDSTLQYTRDYNILSRQSSHGCNVTQNSKSSSFELKLPKNTKLSEAEIEIDVQDVTNEVTIAKI